MPDPRAVSATQREAIAERAFAVLKPFDRYAMLPGPSNRIVDIDLADPRVIDALAGWLDEARRDEREQIKARLSDLHERGSEQSFPAEPMFTMAEIDLALGVIEGSEAGVPEAMPHEVYRDGLAYICKRCRRAFASANEAYNTVCPGSDAS